MVNCISKYGQYKAFASLQYYSMGGCIRRCTTTLAFVRRGASKERGGTRCPGSAASEARAARLVCENMPNTVVCITWVCTPKTRFLQATEQSGVSNKILETFEGTSPLQ